MPEIQSNFHIKNIDKNRVVDLSTGALKTIGGIDLTSKESDNITVLSTTVPSVWGWGGMKIELTVSAVEANSVEIVTKGYIAQLATSPLAKKIDEFKAVLAERLKKEYNYDLVFEPHTGFTKSPKMTFNKMDKTVFIAILVLILIPIFAGTFSKELELLLGGLFIYGGYYYGKNYIYKSKE